MYNFFIENPPTIDGVYKILGSDFNHIKNVLRMKVGEKFLVSALGKSDLCELFEYGEDYVSAKIVQKDFLSTNLPIEIYLFQGLPKSDKMELIVQKTVELGVHEIIPVEMSRSIVKYDDKKKKAKTERYQAIAESAAKQSKRNYIPRVRDAFPYADGLEIAKSLDLILIPYESESGMQGTIDALKEIKQGSKIGVFIGPEGGFDYLEIEKAQAIGGKIISLGSRILRTETAAITTTALLMLHAEMNI